MNIDILLEKLKAYYNVRFLKDIASKIGVEGVLISVWKKRNSVAQLIKHLTEKDLKALEFIFASNATIADVQLSNTILYKVREEARKSGLEVNQYVEHLLIQSLRKAS